MSDDPSKEKLMELLATVYSDIAAHAKEEMLPTAEKNFYSTRDYALGDTISCTPEAALENCEQIKGCFPPGVPKSVFENINKVQNEIRRLEKRSGVNRLTSLVIPGLILAAIAVAVYFVLYKT